MVVRYPHGHQDQLFYTTVKDRQWTAVNTGELYRPAFTYSFSGTVGPQRPSIVTVSTPDNPKVATVVAYSRLRGSGKAIPIALSKIGRLALWAYKYNSAVFSVTRVVVYDSHGT
ncbi:hypothetical protein [Sulfobacillus harzensis]|uniref:Uncharacterized protein n=1 Tax=Sulfobacillus harzensis TaxID=2729629 RepID=A0A7Y0Q2R6_9FIRM|nr:hypothetical protein [Sulfobacillus harzensis]NMP22817.1 hypothetical protein [Sulfobacillus harzensis]